MKCLNLGCGSRSHPEFVNIDVVSSGPHVRVHDLNKGIPFPDDTFDIVYHSHLLEHLTKEKALDFLQECFRVLKKQGIIRVAVPDLEQIARTYLEALDKASRGDKEWGPNYDWMMLELYDQVVRVRSGGDMAKYLKQNSIPNERFIYDRIGGEARRVVQMFQERDSGGNPDDQVRDFFAQVLAISRSIRARLLKLVLGEEDYKKLEVGRFRASGEIHQWMYDRYSLARILRQAGFQNPKAVGVKESQIPDWTKYSLDSEPDGQVCKPDSLFMEAIKL
jgi:predicted SAM-dependent methyltransferase